ncbi:Hypothetical protein IALB_2471 [Ignavibacterium album JCM 16511]|uniref:Uncharacterized protein n=1 Tax=Ignavibacterium album (strain DSM 19864 / JCM 16511 / NBRC 101810 / Mat9-16) TaxID=945713 RepID=I0AMG7_IGNAJ|nr:hypothetical protein [Ignavibacterium album]AFH50174.1 Hypothetical protein IALB_2471 [Ignavibacterium album JCM 16511]
MARMKKQVLGKVSGGVGDLVFRNRNENNYIALKPIRFNTPMDDRAVARRNKFKSAVQLASAINSIVPLKEQWSKKTAGNNTVYNRIVKANYPTIINMLPSEYTLLMPGKGFSFVTQTISLSQDDVKLSTEAIGNDAGLNTEIEKQIRMTAVLCLSGPSNTMYPEVVYLPLISQVQTLVLTDPLNFQINLRSDEKELFNLYGSKRLLAGLLTFNVDSIPVTHSNTLFYQQ